MTVVIVNRWEMSMVSEVRTRMVDGAAILLAKNGLQNTSFSEVLDYTGAPRGSVYHHFPQGKDQLIGEAIDATGARVIAALTAKDGEGAREITVFFLDLWRSVLTRSNLRAGCAVLAVTVATDSPDLMSHTATVFRTWRRSLAGLLERGGLAAAEASGYSALLIASSEGAVVLSRAEQSLEPFDLVSGQLLDQLDRMLEAAPPA
ncbi:TetR/AcrR family transcriptional regulator [Glaciihabitans sp. dw_435]|uniref:TetR/AcrR family transcriptional regulator n=1 Tax=Glaciihabitans sp. dw_435 TaxID=2720081 RepID=UPI001BD3C21D|nr:TetR/AcrR family transcriptional regulator [Glaciihabitans sp. dw_435]